VADDIDIGPIDYVLLEFPGSEFKGEILPEISRLVNSGMVRILEILVVRKTEDGSIDVVDLDEVGVPTAAVAHLSAGTLGLLGDEDIAAAAEALEPGTTAGLLIWENLWAIPMANAVRRAGGQLVATGRIPVQDLIEALDAAGVD
jgi:hypothetical protein